MMHVLPVASRRTDRFVLTSFIRCVLMLLVSYAFAPPALADEIVPVAACGSDKIPLAASAQMVGDRTGMLTPDAVMELPASRFRPVVPGQRLYNASWDWWLRVDLYNATGSECHRWLLVGPARLRDVRAYVREGNSWKAMLSGTAHPFSEWALPERRPVFPLTLPAHSTTRVLVRLVGRGELMSFTPQLWPPVAFQQAEAVHSLHNGLQYGAVLLLVLVSLLLSVIYRRPALLCMALAVGAYVIYLATQDNYSFIYLWSEWPALNLWVRYFLSGLFFAALYRYLYEVMRVRQLGGWWPHLFASAGGVFLLVALFGGLLDEPSRTSVIMFGADQLCRWSLAIAGIMGWRQRTQRQLYPLLLVGLLCFQSIQIYGRMLGLDIPSPAGEHMFLSTILVAGLFLLGTLINQVRQGRQAELNARETLDHQRNSAIERLERTVARRTSELEHALTIRRQLLGRISHDLRAPLAGMLDSLRQWRTGDHSRDYPRLIERHIHQQMDMIDELLEFSQTELTELQPQPVTGDLHAFLNEIAEQVELTSEHHGNQLQRVFADNVPGRVSTDFYYLRRVLINLLGNASKFTQHGCIRFVVQALPAAATDTVWLHFSIDDNGPGIAAQDRERLLQPFARGSNAAHQQGHGLGLAIVTQLLERMGTQLRIDDSPGGGSRFYFELGVELSSENVSVAQGPT